MTASPIVSFVIVSDAAGPSDRAVASCLDQTVADIEVVVVTDGEPTHTPGTPADADPRLRLVTRAEGSTENEARRTGVDAARGGFVLFLDPRDEIEPHTAAELQRVGSADEVDLVEFGAASTQVHADEQILAHLYPAGSSPGGDTGRLAFRASTARAVLALIDSAESMDALGLAPLTFLTAAGARRIATTTVPLYRHRASAETAVGTAAFVSDLEDARSMSALRALVRDRAWQSVNPLALMDTYESVRLRRVADVMQRLETVPLTEREQLAHTLLESLAPVDIAAAAAVHAPGLLPTLAARNGASDLAASEARNILLTTNVLTTGGVSAVLLEQANAFLAAGHDVTIVTHRVGSDRALVPAGARLVELTGSTRTQRTGLWLETLAALDIDRVIDHRILYSRDWPGYAMTARALGVPTIGWIHGFAGRPTFNGNDLHTLLRDNMDALAQLIVLSPLDVAFWQLRGVEHVAYLPNPPSTLVLESLPSTRPKTAPTDRPIEIIWWGRLDEATKRVTQLIEIAASLRRMGADFTMRIVGPDWEDMTAARLSTIAEKRGVGDLVEATGALRGEALIDAIDSADILVNTSIIEGFLLTIPEAQSRGLPVVMYDLPWLLPVQENPGVISVPQGDAEAAAAAVIALCADAVRYEAASRASIDAARRGAATDFTTVYRDLLGGRLAESYSPTPTLEDGRKLLDLFVFFAEHSLPPKGSPARRRRGRASSAGRDVPLGRRLERRLTDPAHRVLAVAPWLRPLARKVKLALLRA